VRKYSISWANGTFKIALYCGNVCWVRLGEVRLGSESLQYLAEIRKAVHGTVIY
jgi:hypothetical protein